MKAVVCEAFGPPEVLIFQEVEKPVPGDKEVLIKVHATTVNAADCNMRGFTYIPTGLGLLARLMLGFNKPKIRIQGSAFAGEIEAVGKEVTSFKPGDQVFGTGPELGAYAEYLCRPAEGAITLKPANLSYAEAAVVPYGALTALYFLRDKAGVKPGQKVLVNGASGGLGVYAVQLAKHFGAEVTGVCGASNLEFVQSLGAGKVIDYKKEDPAKRGEQWDIVFDVVVGKTSFSRFKNALTPNGYYLAVAGGLGDMLQMLRTSLMGGRKVVFGGGADCEKKENLDFLKELLEAGKIKPVVDQTFSLDQIVDAHRHVETGNKRGSVAVQVV